MQICKDDKNGEQICNQFRTGIEKETLCVPILFRTAWNNESLQRYIG